MENLTKADFALGYRRNYDEIMHYSTKAHRWVVEFGAWGSEFRLLIFPLPVWSRRLAGSRRERWSSSQCSLQQSQFEASYFAEHSEKYLPLHYFAAIRHSIFVFTGKSREFYNRHALGGCRPGGNYLFSDVSNDAFGFIWTLLRACVVYGPALGASHSTRAIFPPRKHFRWYMCALLSPPLLRAENAAILP